MPTRRSLASLAIGTLLLAAILFTLQVLKGSDPQPPARPPLLAGAEAIPHVPQERAAPAPESMPEEGLAPLPASSGPDDAPPPIARVPETRTQVVESRSERAGGAAEVLRVEDHAGPLRQLPFEERPYGGRGGALGAPLGSHEVEVPAGWAWIGTPQDWLEGFEGRKNAQLPEALFLEAPRHRVQMPAYLIDRRETTNQEWWNYLVTLRRARDVTQGGEVLRDLVLRFVGRRTTWTEEELLRMERQLLEGNRTVLYGALPASVVRDRDGRLDGDATFDRLRERELPGGLAIDFYRRPPPISWPSTRFEERLSDHPVHGISGEDAVDYALWHGAHVPTEYEWEYAVLGADGPMWPWGNDLVDFGTRVVGGKPLAHGELPATRAAHTQLGGESWVGLAHGVGNVREWTSSYLDPYPDSVSSHSLVGKVLVVRGGSTADQDPYLMRPAQRGWVAAEPQDPPQEPFPWRMLPYVGVRLARFENDVFVSRVICMHTLARSRGALDPSLLSYTPWAGIAGVLTQDLDPERRNPLRVGPGVKSLVLQPLTAPAAYSQPAARYAALSASGELTPQTVVGWSSGTLPLLLGILHSDVHLLDTWVPREQGAGAAGLERVRRADTEPGTWLLGLWHGFPVLLRSDLSEVVLLANRPASEPTLSVVERTLPRDGVPRSAVSVRRQGVSRAEIELEVPGSVKSPDRVYVIRMRLRLSLPAEVLSALVQWEVGEQEFFR